MCPRTQKQTVLWGPRLLWVWVCLRWTDDSRGKVHLFQRWDNTVSLFIMSSSVHLRPLDLRGSWNTQREMPHFIHVLWGESADHCAASKIIINKYKYYTCSSSSLIWVHSSKAIISTIRWRISARGQVRISVKVNHGRSFYFRKTALSHFFFKFEAFLSKLLRLKVW